MSKFINSLLIIAATLITAPKAIAQQPALGCNDKAMRLQAEQLKQDFSKQGFETYKDAMLTMESRQPSPIGVQLEKGKLYQIIFLGSKEAKKMTMELYNGEDKKIDERTEKNTLLQNYMIYSFVPEKTDMYLIVLTQQKGSKQLCGSLTILKKAEQATPRPEAEPANAKPGNTTKPATGKPAPNPRYVPKKK